MTTNPTPPTRIRIVLTEELKAKHAAAALAHDAAASAWAAYRDKLPDLQALTETAYRASGRADCLNGIMPSLPVTTPDQRVEAHKQLAAHHRHMASDVEHDSLWAKKR
jgi:hypothetical protein